MGLDPNIVLNLLLSRREDDRRRELDRQERQRELAMQQGQAEFQLGLRSAMDPDLDTDAFLATFQNLSPAKADLIRSIDKSTKKKAKAQEAAKTAGLRFGAPREDVLSALRIAEQGIGSVGELSPAIREGAMSTATADLLAQFQAARAAEQTKAEATHKEAIQRRQAVSDAGRARFVEGAGFLLATQGNNPETLGSIRKMVQQQFPEAPDTLMAQIATESAFRGVQRGEEGGAPITDAQLRRMQYQAAIADGAPPKLALDAVNNRAFKDPMVGLWRRGSKTGAEASAAGLRTGLVDVFVQLEAMANAFADAGGATALTGSLESLKGKLGAQGDAMFAAYEATVTQAQSLIQKARSGAVLNEKEVELLEKALPQLAQVKLRNGRLAPEVEGRLNAMFRILEAEHVGSFEGDLRLEARNRFRQYRESERTRIRSDVANEMQAISRQDPSGAALLERLKANAGIPAGEP